jgi:hypothetical protein
VTQHPRRFLALAFTSMPAAYVAMMLKARARLGLRECRAAWLQGLTVSEYRALEAGEMNLSSDLWCRMVEVSQRPRSFEGRGPNDPCR